MSEKLEGEIDFAEDFKFIPHVIPKFDIPPDFEIQTPEFKKTSTMSRVQFECNDTIDRLIGWKYTVERKTDAEIAGELGIGKGTVGEYRKRMGIKSRSKSEARRLIIERKKARRGLVYQRVAS